MQILPSAVTVISSSLEPSRCGDHRIIQVNTRITIQTDRSVCANVVIDRIIKDISMTTAISINGQRATTGNINFIATDLFSVNGIS